jgi:uncharacterized membrane protein
MSDAETKVVRGVMGWLKAWPSWLLVIAFLGLALAFGLASFLDDWLRIAVAVLFVAIVAALIGRIAQGKETPL